MSIFFGYQQIKLQFDAMPSRAHFLQTKKTIFEQHFVAVIEKYLNDLFTDCNVKTLFHLHINSSVLPFVLGRFVILTRRFLPPVDNTISALQEDPASYGLVEKSTTFYFLHLNVF